MPPHEATLLPVSCSCHTARALNNPSIKYAAFDGTYQAMARVVLTHPARVTQVLLRLCAEKTRVEIHIFFASHEKRHTIMHRLWWNGQWALAVTAQGLAPGLVHQQGIGVDFEHQAQLSFRQVLSGRIEKNALP